jgi:hypothetical protein
MHVADYQVTTASLVAALAPDRNTPDRIWACLGSPCCSVYLPLLAHRIPTQLGEAALWHRFDALRRRVEADPTTLAEVRGVLDPFEDDCWERAEARWAAGSDDPVAWCADAAALDPLLHRLGA